MNNIVILDNSLKAEQFDSFSKAAHVNYYISERS
jgi:hypothetical protein